jgi:hypothetical protein
VRRAAEFFGRPLEEVADGDIWRWQALQRAAGELDALVARKSPAPSAAR